MYGLTSLGIFHTLISLIALASGIIALLRNKEITWNKLVGKIYVVSTVIVCITGFGIFQHGGFGKAHGLGIVTLIVLGVALLAEKNKIFGSTSPYIAVGSFSATFFFHLIPAFTESLTRLPLDAPIASNPDDPKIQLAVGICFLLFVIGVTMQILKLKSKAR